VSCSQEQKDIRVHVLSLDIYHHSPDHHHPIFPVSTFPRLFLRAFISAVVKPAMMFPSLLVGLVALPLAFAVPKPSPYSNTLSKRCTNSATDRSCWGDYDTSTNYYSTVPDTGVTREYWFDVQNGTASPDGIERIVLTVNGTIPGPTIIADWGDTVGEYTIHHLGADTDFPSCARF
jgi:hypothetical protein